MEFVFLPDMIFMGLIFPIIKGKIDWGRLLQNKQTATPLHFVFMKATEGGDHNDTTFQTNFANARNHGFIRGAYHFYIPGTDALKQADFFIRRSNWIPATCLRFSMWK